MARLYVSPGHLKHLPPTSEYEPAEHGLPPSQSFLAEILETSRGEFRFVPEVPSPTCRNHLVSRTISCLPTNTQPHREQAADITWPWSFQPQHETAPLLRTAQECDCRPYMRLRTRIHSSRHSTTQPHGAINHRHFPDRKPSTPQQPKTAHTTTTTITAAHKEATQKPQETCPCKTIVLRLKLHLQRRCPNQQQQRA